MPIPLGFRRFQAADLSDWHGQETHPEFQRILSHVAGIVGRKDGGYSESKLHNSSSKQDRNGGQDFASKPPPPLERENLDYGQELPPVVLIFILVLVYSTLTPIILLFGTIYFLFGYINFKYLLLYGMSILLRLYHLLRTV